MKVIVAGTRQIRDPNLVMQAIICSGFTITELVSGGAIGPDTIGENLAYQHGIPVKKFLAQWDHIDKNSTIKIDKNGNKYDATAGFRRNFEMAKYADAAVLIWDKKSKGTKHMIQCMVMLQKPHYIHYIS